MFPIRSLETRFIVFLLVPVTLLMIAMGTAGFFYARRIMFIQWEEASVLKLQRVAHLVDMRLSRPKDLVRLYLESQGEPMAEQVRRVILRQLREIPGVLRATRSGGGNVDEENLDERPMGMGNSHAPMMAEDGAEDRADDRMYRMHSKRLSITLPRYDADIANETVSLMARTEDDEGRVVESLEVVLDFRFLIGDLPQSDQWHIQNFYLVDQEGRILVSGKETPREHLGDGDDPLEKTTLTALKEKVSGTVRGIGHPPKEISGFHRLAEAPWVLVAFAPGREILGPILHFRNVYFIILAVFILAILLLIHHVVSRTTRSVRALSAAADRIAGGRFGESLEVSSRDEIGELIRSFNTMSRQLKERMQMKRSLDLAKEVQQNLIPGKDPVVEGLDIAGRSEFCDETGGDYYDYIENNDGGGRIRIMVGDVAGHGVASALLMGGVRASLRQRHAVSGSIEEVVADVNRQVALDVGGSGRFMTLFCLEIDVGRRSASWVRAGHEPGLLYRIRKDRFEQLMGEGLPLGIDQESAYTSKSTENLESGDLFVLG
ncbi:MAG: PP2C family protein-serine/threonine phosphatase, partial [Desulfobacterales bacterium]